MKFSRKYVILSYVTLGLSLPGCVLFQFAVCLLAGEIGQKAPEVAHLVVPYSIMGVAALACAQILIVTLLMLVRAVSHGTFFTPETRRWVEMARIMVALGPGLAAATFLHMMFFTPARHPVLVLGFLGSATLGVGLFSLVSLAQSIFTAAWEDKAELEAVI